MPEDLPTPKKSLKQLEKENCPVRYMPERKKAQIYDGTRYVTRCEKDEKAREDTM